MAKAATAANTVRGTEADLLVLDEPTANLDPEAEYRLFETIKRIRKGLTTVYISHRFNTVRAADKIMVMGKGSVIEFGSHEELMALKVRMSKMHLVVTQSNHCSAQAE